MGMQNGRQAQARAWMVCTVSNGDGETVLNKLFIIESTPIDKAAASTLITGESGAGKGSMATLIQQYASQTEKPQIRINRGAISESLVASELFGHENEVARKLGCPGSTAPQPARP